MKDKHAMEMESQTSVARRTFQNQRGQDRGKGEEEKRRSGNGSHFSPCLAGDPGIAGACEQHSCSVSLLWALDGAACLWLCLLGGVCGK
jgi:hypothetical protein